MIRKLVSDYRAASVYQVRPEAVKDLGVDTVFMDLDNTLAPYDQAMPERRTFELIDSYHALGLEVIIISNSRQRRAWPFAEKLHVKCIHSARKPFSNSLKAYLAAHSIAPEHAFLFGDQVINDMIMARLAGVRACLVDPLSPKDYFLTRLIRPLDRCLRRRYLSQNRLGLRL